MLGVESCQGFTIEIAKIISKFTPREMLKMPKGFLKKKISEEISRENSQIWL